MTMTKRYGPILLTALVAGLSLSACQKEEAAPTEEAVQAPVPVPTTDDTQAWHNYVTDAVTRNMGKITRSPYVYFLPAEAAGAAQPVEVADSEAAAGDTADENVTDQSASALGALSMEPTSEYGRLLQKAQEDIGRGILPGNMLAFASPVSARMADLMVASFADVDPGSMDGIRVLFIGDAVDNDRVKAVVEPTGATYVFVEAK